MALAASPLAGSPAIDYDLVVHDGEVTTVFRVRDHGIRLIGDRLEWHIDGNRRDAALANIQAIRLTTEVETSRGPMGTTSCQIRFYSGPAVTVFGGNSFSADPAERRARYEAFVTELHRRLGPAERARIRFVAGFGGARFSILLVATLISTLFLILAPLALLFGGKPSLRVGVAVVVGGILTASLFRLLQLNAPHLYDPADPLGSATSGSIGDTFAHAFDEFRRRMTLAQGVGYAATAVVVIAVLVLVVASHQRVNLFEPGEARSAFDAVFARAGPGIKAIYVEVKPDGLLIESPPGSDTSRRTDWRANRRTLFGWSEWDDVNGPTDRYPMSMSDEPGREPFVLERDDTAHLDDLAKAALVRAGPGDGTEIGSMVMIRDFDFAHPEPPRWTVLITKEGLFKAEVIADRHGQLYPATPKPAGPPRIVIKIAPPGPFAWFPGSGTWISLVNPDRSVLFDKALNVGESYSVPDVAGLILQTGKPETLEVTVDGHPVQLPRATGDQGRLEMVLDPQALLAGSTARDQPAYRPR